MNILILFFVLLNLVVADDKEKPKVTVGKYFKEHDDGKAEVKKIDELQGMLKEEKYPLTDALVKNASICVSSSMGKKCKKDDFAKTTKTMMEYRSLNIATRELDKKLKDYSAEHLNMSEDEKKYYDFAKSKQEYLISLNQDLLCKFPGSSYECNPKQLREKKAEYEGKFAAVDSLEIDEETFKSLNVALESPDKKFLEQSLRYGFECCNKEKPGKECKTEKGEDKCVLGYGAYLASLTIAEGEEPVLFPKVEAYTGDACTWLGAVGPSGVAAATSLTSAILGFYAAKRAGEDGYEGSAAKYAAMSKALGGSSPIVGVYDSMFPKTQVFPSFTTQASGGTSLTQEGAAPSNPFAPASTDQATTAAGERTGTQGAIDMLSGFARGIASVGASSATFNSNASGLSALESQNLTLSTNLTTASASPSPVGSGLERFTSSLQGGDDATALSTAEEEWDRIQEGQRVNTSLMGDAYAKFAECKAMAMYAGRKRMVEALQCASDAQVQLAMAEANIGVLNYEAMAYRMPYQRVSMLNDFIKYAFDMKVMYCSNSSDFKRVITPITNKERETWLKEARMALKNVNAEMERRKRAINEAKRNLKEALKQEIIVSKNLKEAPDGYKIALELNNMNVIRKSAKENIGRIDKAMDYHKGKRAVTPKNLYEEYEREASYLKTSMKEVIDVIDKTEPELRRSLTIATKANLEVPKNEYLRKAAKEMVQKGY